MMLALVGRDLIPLCAKGEKEWSPDNLLRVHFYRSTIIVIGFIWGRAEEEEWNGGFIKGSLESKRQ